VLLKGHCRYCHSKLSAQYPLVELATGGIFVCVYYLLSRNFFVDADYMNNAVHILDFGVSIPLIYYFIVTTALISLFLTDFKFGMLYDKIIFPTIIFVILYKISVIAYYGYEQYIKLNSSAIGQAFLKAGLLNNHLNFATKTFIETIIGSFAIALFFLILIIVTKGRGMGGGDLKLGFLVGLLSGWPNMVASIFVGFLTGAIASCILLIAKKKNIGQTVPFGPFLILACFIVMFFGNQLFNWYIKDIVALK
jgi:leader peptidase (prepilin peptidase)/N-methyltransferase